MTSYQIYYLEYIQTCRTKTAALILVALVYVIILYFISKGGKKDG